MSAYSIKQYPLLNISLGWLVMLLCGFLGGWTLADTSWQRPYPVFLTLLGGLVALRVGFVMEHHTSQSKEQARASHRTWITCAFLGVALGALALLQKAPVQKEIVSEFYALLSATVIVFVMMFSIVVGLGVVEKYIHDDQPITNKETMPWWISAASSAVIVATLGFAGVHLSMKHQSNPHTVWGWWNETNHVTREYKAGSLSYADFENRIKHLEIIRQRQAQKRVAQRLLPHDNFLPQMIKEAKRKNSEKL